MSHSPAEPSGQSFGVPEMRGGGLGVESGYAGRWQDFANGLAWRFTLREKPSLYAWLAALGEMLAIGAALAWIGPYGTFRDLDTWHRFVYWMLTVPLIGIPTSLAIRAVAHSVQGAAWPPAVQAIVGALVSSIPGTFVVIALDGIFRSPIPVTPLSIARCYVSVLILSMIIAVPMTVIRSLTRAQPKSAAPTQAAAAAPIFAASGGASPFLRRIPDRLGTELLFIATEDHYLRVTTSLGSDLILFRLADAIAELDPAQGQQVHRSYWVARRALAKVERSGHRTWLVLSNGAQIPVSRTYLPALREAGWLAA